MQYIYIVCILWVYNYNSSVWYINCGACVVFSTERFSSVTSHCFMGTFPQRHCLRPRDPVQHKCQNHTSAPQWAGTSVQWVSRYRCVRACVHSSTNVNISASVYYVCTWIWWVSMWLASEYMCTCACVGCSVCEYLWAHMITKTRALHCTTAESDFLYFFSTHRTFALRDGCASLFLERSKIADTLSFCMWSVVWSHDIIFCTYVFIILSYACTDSS